MDVQKFLIVWTYLVVGFLFPSISAAEDGKFGYCARRSDGHPLAIQEFACRTSIVREDDGDIMALMARYRLPGVSIATIKDGQTRPEVDGVRSTKTQGLLTSSTLFQAASSSKPLAAVDVLKFVQDGRITLYEPIYHWLTPAYVGRIGNPSYRTSF